MASRSASGALGVHTRKTPNTVDYATWTGSTLDRDYGEMSDRQLTQSTLPRLGTGASEPLRHLTRRGARFDNPASHAFPLPAPMQGAGCSRSWKRSSGCILEEDSQTTRMQPSQVAAVVIPGGTLVYQWHGAVAIKGYVLLMGG